MGRCDTTVSLFKCRARSCDYDINTRYPTATQITFPDAADDAEDRVIAAWLTPLVPLFRPDQREKDRLPYTEPRQGHQQPIDPHSDAPARGHSVLERA